MLQEQEPSHSRIKRIATSARDFVDHHQYTIAFGGSALVAGAGAVVLGKVNPLEAVGVTSFGVGVGFIDDNVEFIIKGVNKTRTRIAARKNKHREHTNLDTIITGGEEMPVETVPAHVDRVYEDPLVLPEGIIYLPDLIIENKANGEMEELLDSTKRLMVGYGTREITRLMTPLKESQTLSLVILDSSTMGIPDGSTTEQVWKRIAELGFENELPPQAGIFAAIEAAKGNIRVEIGKQLVVVMKPILVHGTPSVLLVEHDHTGALGVYGNSAFPDVPCFYKGARYLAGLRK